MPLNPGIAEALNAYHAAHLALSMEVGDLPDDALFYLDETYDDVLRARCRSMREVEAKGKAICTHHAHGHVPVEEVGRVVADIGDVLN